MIACNTDSHYHWYSYHGNLQYLICDSVGNKLGAGVFSTDNRQVFDLIQTKDRKFVVSGGEKPFAIKFGINDNNTIVPVWSIMDFDVVPFDGTNEFKSLNQLADGNLLLSGSLYKNGIQLIRHTKIRSSDGSVLWNRYYDYYDGHYSFTSATGSSYILGLPYLYSVHPCSDNGWVASLDWYMQPSEQSTFHREHFDFIKYGENGCDSTLAYCDVWLGVKELTIEDLQWKIYPNPANDLVNIECEKLNGEVKITDVLGKEIINEKLKMKNGKTQINVSELKNGIYFFQVYEKGKLLGVQKVIKN